tara:strand:+ start:1102 stop:1224 length:123 start_codon:yes stop_codon:yes gene_type:complete
MLELKAITKQVELKIVLNKIIVNNQAYLIRKLNMKTPLST